MKKNIILSFLSASLLVVLSAAYSFAVTVTAVPNPALPGQSVNISVDATFSTSWPTCDFWIYFGDGTDDWLGACHTNPCNMTTNHTYPAAGSYTITAESFAGGCGDLPAPPDPGTTVLQVSSPSTLTAAVNPAIINVERSMASVHNIAYSFTLLPAGNKVLQSTTGSFLSGGDLIGTVNSTVNAVVTNGLGNASELLRVPVSVIIKAETLGRTAIIFTRTFTDGILNVDIDVELNITTGAAAAFNIKRMRIYFNNNRADISVDRNDRSLKAFLDIDYTGSGLLRGYWEVDGHFFSNVFRHFVYGTKATIDTPPAPPLPTFVQGTHRIRFVITEPAQDIDLPEAIFFVTGREAAERILPINLVQPPHNSLIGFMPGRFSWEGRGGIAAYRIEFFETGGDTPVFSAYVRGSFYILPQTIIDNKFEIEKGYLWIVKGFDANNELVAESRTSNFFFSADRLPERRPAEEVSFEMTGFLHKEEGVGGIRFDMTGMRSGAKTAERINFEMTGFLHKEEGVGGIRFDMTGMRSAPEALHEAGMEETGSGDEEEGAGDIRFEMRGMRSGAETAERINFEMTGMGP